MARQDLPPDGFVDEDVQGPPDGFADETGADAPPDGFAGDDEPKSRLKKLADLVKNGWSAFQDGVHFVGEQMEHAKDASGYRTTPQGLLEEGYNAVSRVANQAGEKVAEGLAEGVSPVYDPLMPGNVGVESTPGKGVRLPPTAAAVVGSLVQYAPDIIMGAAEPTGTIEGALKNAVPEAGLTSVGKKVAQGVAKIESVAPAAENVIKLPTGAVKILDVSKVPQPLVDKLAFSKQTALKIENKLAKVTEELDEFTKTGPEGLTTSVREQEWLGQIDRMKTEHGDLLKTVNEEMFEASLNGKSKPYLDRLNELKLKKDQLLKDHENLAMIGPKEQELLDRLAEKKTELQQQFERLQTPSPVDVQSAGLRNMGHKQYNPGALKVEIKLNQLEALEKKAMQRFDEAFKSRKARMAQSVNKLEVDINEVGRDFGTFKEQSLFKLKDKTKALEEQVKQVEAKYRLHRMEKFNKHKDKLTELAAYAENDLRNLGFTSKDIEDGFVKFVQGTPAGSKVVSAAEKGNIISKDLYDGIVASPDISGFNADMGQFTTNFDELDKFTKGAFSREVKQDLYNKSIQSYEISNHFLDKVNKLMEKHGLTDADGQTFTRFVEGEIGAPPGREAAFAAAKEQMKAITDEALDLRNARRTQRGEEAIPRRDNYITAAMEQSLKDDLYIPAKEAIKGSFIKKKSAEFGFDQPRQDLIPEDMRMGAFEVIKMYTTKTAREVSLSDSVEKLRALAETAQKSKKPNMANYLNSVADRLTGEAFTNAVKNMAVSAEKSKVLQKAMELGGNYSSNVVNQIGAGLNQINSVMLASKDIGMGRAILSVPSGFLSEMKEQILKAAANPAYESFATENSKVLRLMTSRETAQAMRSTKKFGPLAAVNDWTFKFFNDMLYKGVFNQAYKAARTSGYAHSVAVKVADAVVEKSQGIFEDALKPAIISTHHPILQLAAPLQTAVMNTFNVLKNDVVFAKLTPMEKAATVGRMAATGAITNAMIALATGKKPSAPDAIPFFRLAQLGIGGIFSPVAKLAQGKPMQAAEQALLMTPQMRKLGGLQTMKTIKGAKQLLSGDSVDPRVLIFGPKPKEKKGG